MATRHLLVPLLVILSIPAMVGCGGGSGAPPQPSGRAVVTVVWPERNRLIPMASNSVKATFTRNGEVVASQVIARPAEGGSATATFENLKVGDLVLTAVAYPQANGTGVPQARGSTSVTIVADETTEVTVTMASTIDRLEITPTAPSVLVGETTALAMTARDAQGNVVLTWPANTVWESLDPSYATVDDAGTVTGVKPTGVSPGSVDIQVTETESGKSATAAVAVTSNTIVTVTPESRTISVGDRATFAATVENAADTSVTWSIQEGAAGGTITQGGTYTAPAVPGTYHVVATSNYDNARSDSATVVVQAGNAIVTIN